MTAPIRESRPVGGVLAGAAAVSLVLHAAAGLALIARPYWVLGPAPPPPLATVELVTFGNAHVGNPGAHPQPPPPNRPTAPPAPVPPPAPANPLIPPQRPTASAEPAPSPVSRPPPKVSTAAANAAAPPPEIRIDDPDSLGNGLIQPGAGIIPAAVDQAIRNRAPAYPKAAAELGEQGTVSLTIHVDPDGHASSVDIAESSGSVILDNAARDAISKWQFHPATQNGVPVSSELPLNIRFALDDH